MDVYYGNGEWTVSHSQCQVWQSMAFMEISEPQRTIGTLHIIALHSYCVFYETFHQQKDYDSLMVSNF